MDYLTPLEHRKQSFKEFVEEWILDHFLAELEANGLERPWYWETFLRELDSYHHMVYASAYTHRATVWFDLALPGPNERAWLAEKYPASWAEFDPVWERVTERWKKGGPELEWFTHGATPVGFCDLCQLVLCGGSPTGNTAQIVDHAGRRYVFCSEPCAWIFREEPERYAAHQSVVQRILSGEAPGNLIELVRKYFGLTEDTWGKDVERGQYSWLVNGNGRAGATR
jgi:toluene monooxygenase system protein A